MTLFLCVLWTLVLLTAQTPASPSFSDATRFGLTLPTVTVASPEWELRQLEPLTLQGRNLPAERTITITLDTASGEIQESVQVATDGTVLLERTLFANLNGITITMPNTTLTNTIMTNTTARLEVNTTPQQVNLPPTVLLTRTPFSISDTNTDTANPSTTNPATAAATSAPADQDDGVFSQLARPEENATTASTATPPEATITAEATTTNATENATETATEAIQTEASNATGVEAVEAEPADPVTPEAAADTPQDASTTETVADETPPETESETDISTDTMTTVTEETSPEPSPETSPLPADQAPQPSAIPAWLRSLANVGWYMAYTLVGVIIALRITLLCKYWVAQSEDIEAYWRKYKDVPRFTRLNIVRYFSLLEKLVLLLLFAVTVALATLGNWAQQGFTVSAWSALARAFTNPWTSLASANPPGFANIVWQVALVVFLLAALLALITLILPRLERAKTASRTPLYVLFALLVPGSGLVDEDAAGLGLFLLLAWALIGLSVLRELYDLPFQFDLGIWGGLEALAGLYLLNAFALLGVLVWSRRKQQQLKRTVA
jgi:hypothetical protein